MSPALLKRIISKDEAGQTGVRIIYLTFGKLETECYKNLLALILWYRGFSFLGIDELIISFLDYDWLFRGQESSNIFQYVIFNHV